MPRPAATRAVAHSHDASRWLWWPKHAMAVSPGVVRLTAREIPINVRDMDEGRAWYERALGVRFDGLHRTAIGATVLVLFAFPDVRPCSYVVA
jgi:hypothetical protein